jgi:hypothetical protein
MFSRLASLFRQKISTKLMSAVYLQFISALLILETELQISRLQSDSGHTGTYKPRDVGAYRHAQANTGTNMEKVEQASVVRAPVSHTDIAQTIGSQMAVRSAPRAGRALPPRNTSALNSVRGPIAQCGRKDYINWKNLDYLIGSRIRDLPASRKAPQPLRGLMRCLNLLNLPNPSGGTSSWGLVGLQKNEHQKEKNNATGEQRAAGTQGLQPHRHPWADRPYNAGASTSHNPIGHHGLLRKQIYFLLL